VVAANTAPTISRQFGLVMVDEGTTAANLGSYSDSTGDTVTITASVGTITDKTGTNSGNWEWEFATTDGNDQSQTVTITATDNHGAQNTASFNLTVNNVAPTVSLSGPTSANEGQSRHYTFTSSDPGADTISLGSQSCGSGNTLSNAVFNADGSGSFDCTFPDGPATSTVSVQVQDSDGALSNTSSVIVNVQNVAPTVSLSGPTSANEGPGAVSYTFTTSDPGADTFSLAGQSCGVGNTLSNAVFNADGSGSFDCTFPDGPATSTVSVQVQDSDDALSNTSAIIVNVANLNPTATLSNNGPISEGGSATISFSNQADASTLDAAAGFKYVYSCDGSPITVTTYDAASTSASTSCAFGDNGSMTVRGRIFDKDDGYTDYVTYVVVNNVVPIKGTDTFFFNPYTGVANASISFSDPGWLDTVTATWAGLPVAPATVGPRETPGLLAGTFTASHTFPGCVADAIAVNVRDDDGGYFNHQFAAASTLGAYTASFMAPIKEGARNIVKLGNVIPVKVTVLDCHGTPVLNRTLQVWLVSGVTAEDIANGENLTEGTSVSSADNGNQMRIVDGHYMLNLATKGLKTGVPFTIIIKDIDPILGTQNIATAAIELKK
jgi:hypothetical protein